METSPLVSSLPLRVLLGLVAFVAGCATEVAPALPSHVTPPADASLLSAWELFADGAAQVPAADVVPFTPNAPAISDHADKYRFVRIPAGTVIDVDAAGHWVLPIGTVLAKTFAFDGRLIETRLFVRLETGWAPYVYRWNAEASDAVRITDGADVPVRSVDPMTGVISEHDWHVAADTECVSCHGDRDGVMTPLALRTDQLEREDQIDRFVAHGMLATRPLTAAALVDYHDETAPTEARARAYLHGNCASCHREAGLADDTGVRLGIEVTDLFSLGVCRPPTLSDPQSSGGRPWIIAPGEPARSVMAHRLESTVWGVHMPFGSTVIDQEGIDLLTAWMGSMPVVPCE